MTAGSAHRRAVVALVLMALAVQARPRSEVRAEAVTPRAMVAAVHGVDDSLRATGRDDPSVFAPQYCVDSTNIQWVYPVIAGTSILMFYVIYEYDQQSYAFLYDMKERSHSISNVSKVVTIAGDGTFSIGVFAPLYLGGLISGDHTITRVGRLGLESFLLTGISVQLLKHLFGRERPSEATMPGGRFHGPFAYYSQKVGPHRGIAAFDAFPSGHTATVFSMAETFSIVFDKTWVSCLAYGIATLTAFSRITERTHWISDCIAGAAMGIAITRLTSYWDKDGGPVSFQPYSSYDTQGLSFVLRF